MHGSAFGIDGVEPQFRVRGGFLQQIVAGNKFQSAGLGATDRTGDVINNIVVEALILGEELVDRNSGDTGECHQHQCLHHHHAPSQPGAQ